METLETMLEKKEFQIYALSEFGNILFAYSPKLTLLSDQCLRVLPFSIQFTSLPAYTFQRLVLGDLTVILTQGCLVHNDSVIWGFFYESLKTLIPGDYSLFFLSLFLKFLSSKPNTLQGILNTEKDKTDRQGSEFGLRDLTAETLNTYNDCFQNYKEFIETELSDFFRNFQSALSGFSGFVMTLDGDLVQGNLGKLEKFKEMIAKRGKIMRDSYKHDFSTMKVELNLISKKIVMIAGLCPVLDGLIVGLAEESHEELEGCFKLVHNAAIFWDSDHGPLAQRPERLYNIIEKTADVLKEYLQVLVPRSIQGPKFCAQVSPGQSRIHLSQELNLERLPISEVSFNVSTILHVDNFENDLVNPISNISIIEKNLEEDIEDYFGISQDRVTPGLVNLDEIVEEVQGRRSRTPSQIDERSQSPNLMRGTKNGRWFRKSTDMLKKKPEVPRLGLLPPIKSEKILVRVKRSNSSKDLRDFQLLEFEDQKKLGIKDIQQCIEKYAVRNHRPPRDDWIDFD